MNLSQEKRIDYAFTGNRIQEKKNHRLKKFLEYERGEVKKSYRGTLNLRILNKDHF